VEKNLLFLLRVVSKCSIKIYILLIHKALPWEKFTLGKGLGRKYLVVLLPGELPSKTVFHNLRKFRVFYYLIPK